jgi:ketosteroid isomerase-like protein
MRRPEIPPPATLSSADDCEQQFYEAMQQGDVERLMALWADDDEIACVHPGGQRLVGPEAIRASFTALFRNGGVHAQVDRVRKLLIAETAVHHVTERVQAQTSEGPRFALVIVTNVYVSGALGWRMVVHHASPNMMRGVVIEGAPGGRPTRQSDAPDDEGPTTLH